MSELITTTPFLLYVAMGLAAVMWAIVTPSIIKLIRFIRKNY